MVKTICIVIQIARDWQTLIAGLVALFAAYITVREIRRQIKLQERQIANDEARYNDEQRRKLQRARALLPDALSGFANYCDGCVRYLAGDQNDLPADPEPALDAIKRAIEFVEPDVADKLTEIVNSYQIQHSRLHHYGSKSGEAERRDRIYDAVRLRYLSGRMFYYARNQAEDEQSPRDGMLNALRVSVGISEYFSHEAKWAPIVSLIDERHPTA